METICLFVSCLALLAATVSLALLFREIKRNQKRSTAALQYTDNSRQQTILMAEQMLKTNLDPIFGRLDALEKGAVPDYEEQKKASDAVNEFAKGISAILGFDPMEALRKEQEKR